MKTIWRLFYPIAIYVGITSAISVGGMLLIAAFLTIGLVRAEGADLMTEAAVIYNQNILLITLVSAVISIPILGWFFHRDQMMRGESTKIQNLNKSYIYLVILGISACIAGNNLITLSGIDQVFKGYEEVSDNLYQSPIWQQLIGVGIVIPVVEELTFRALGFRRLRDHMSFYWAAAVSALCFGVFHGNLVQGLYAFLLGYLMAWTYETYNSFLAPVIFHCSANMISILLTLTVAGDLLYRNQMTIWITTVTAAVLTAGCICYTARYVKAPAGSGENDISGLL